MRTVMVAVPAYDGNVCIEFAVALAEAIKLSLFSEINLCPIYFPGEALLPHARNELLKLAVESKVDDLIWIDADIGFDPQWILDLLNYPVDVVGGTYPRKCDAETYVCKGDPDSMVPDGHGLVEVQALGTGFARMSAKAYKFLWNRGAPYTRSGAKLRMAFDWKIDENGELMSEDVAAFTVLRESGFKIYLDPRMTCSHVGRKVYQGDFSAWFAKLDLAQNL